MKYTKAQMLRFPLIFGTILAGFAIAFVNREKFMSDLEEERNKLNREEEGSRQVILETIDSFNKTKAARQHNK